MKSPEYIYTNPQEHLSEEQLRRYQSGQSEPAEMHRMEQHLLDCELCSDAEEGLAQLDAGETAAAMEELKSRLATRLAAEESSTAKTYWPWAVAASVLLLFAASLFLLLPDQTDRPQELVQTEDWQNEEGSTAEREPEQAPREETEDPPSRAYADEQAEDEFPAGESPTGQSRTEVQENTGSQVPPPPQPQQPALQVSPDLAIVEAEDMEVITEEIIFEEAPAEILPESIRIAGTNQGADSPTQAGREELPQRSRSLAENSRTTLAPNQTVDPGVGYRTLSGRITDTYGEPVPGASIRLKGSPQGTITNFKGEYSLQLPATDTSIEIAFIGYVQKTVPVSKTDTHIQAVLEEDVKSLSEVVVTGRQTRRQRDATGSVSETSSVSSPRPKGGPRRFRKYVRQQQQYPAEALESGIEGTVVLEFYVERDGRIGDIKVTQALGYGLDEEAIRLLKEGPDWKPAIAGSDSIRQKAEISIPFKLK